jgi:hypothetical protein
MDQGYKNVTLDGVGLVNSRFPDYERVNSMHINTTLLPKTSINLMQITCLNCGKTVNATLAVRTYKFEASETIN